MDKAFNQSIGVDSGAAPEEPAISADALEQLSRTGMAAVLWMAFSLVTWHASRHTHTHTVMVVGLARRKFSFSQAFPSSVARENVDCLGPVYH